VTQNRLYPHEDLRVEVRGDEIALPSRSATALTLVVNELIQNALKHAFVGREAGSITVALRSHPPGFDVEVQDDGVGLTPGEPPPHSLGLQIVEALVGQDLGGQLNIERNGLGTRVTIHVPNLAGGGEAT
jgi:two-component sensor histidine kinase